MMLQKGEFIDATSRGGLARFCNHSCNPNCYVDKWVVGDKLRMGIFTKRDILPGEEITFDYNVDRYGADAQPCYCGEPNCIGILGGKTQTEAVNKLPQLLLDALDMDASDEDTWISNNVKRKKKRKSEEELDEDYSASLPTKPISLNSVSKIMSSLMQSREEWLVNKLITRIANTDDKAIHLRVMQMHGYQIFNNLLRDWKSNKSEEKSDDTSIVKTILEIMTRWPRLTKNKISSSKIELTVEELSKECQDDEVKELAKTLLTEWGSLEMAYRIPRREKKSNSTENPDDEEQQQLNKEDSEQQLIQQNNPETQLSSSSSSSSLLYSQFNPQSSQPQQQLQQQQQQQQQPYFKKFKRFGTTPVENNQDRYADLRLPEGPRKIVLAQQAAAAAAALQAQLAAINDTLPFGWRSAEAPDGKIYYYNRELNLTQWERPANPKINQHHHSSVNLSSMNTNNPNINGSSTNGFFSKRNEGSVSYPGGGLNNGFEDNNTKYGLDGSIHNQQQQQQQQQSLTQGNQWGITGNEPNNNNNNIPGSNNTNINNNQYNGATMIESEIPKKATQEMTLQKIIAEAMQTQNRQQQQQKQQQPQSQLQQQQYQIPPPPQEILEPDLDRILPPPQYGQQHYVQGPTSRRSSVEPFSSTPFGEYNSVGGTPDFNNLNDSMGSMSHNNSTGAATTTITGNGGVSLVNSSSASAYNSDEPRSVSMSPGFEGFNETQVRALQKAVSIFEKKIFFSIIY